MEIFDGNFCLVARIWCDNGWQVYILSSGWRQNYMIFYSLSHTLNSFKHVFKKTFILKLMYKDSFTSLKQTSLHVK